MKRQVPFDPLVFLLSAPSGTGKSTLVAELIASVPGLRRIVTCTTRPPRADERAGEAYFFFDRAEFDARIARGEFIEWNEIYGDRYGTARRAVEEGIEQARERGEDLVLVIDVDGKENFLKEFGEAVTIFVLPPSIEEIERRLCARGSENAADVAKRLERAREEIARAGGYRYQVANDSKAAALRKLQAIVAAERARRDAAGVDNSTQSC